MTSLLQLDEDNKLIRIYKPVYSHILMWVTKLLAILHKKKTGKESD